MNVVEHALVASEAHCALRVGHGTSEAVMEVVGSLGKLDGGGTTSTGAFDFTRSNGSQTIPSNI